MTHDLDMVLCVEVTHTFARRKYTFWALVVTPNHADTSALESEIDRIVYRLYDLTPEEIAVAESSSK